MPTRLERNKRASAALSPQRRLLCVAVSEKREMRRERSGQESRDFGKMTTSSGVVWVRRSRLHSLAVLACAREDYLITHLLQQQEKMFIRVALPDKEEGIFNTDCSVATLLDAIKKRHNISLGDQIDLCSEDGNVKNLKSNDSADSAAPFFEARELCLVVRVLPSSDNADDKITYVPILSEYQEDEEFVAFLNDPSINRHSGYTKKGHKRYKKPVTPGKITKWRSRAVYQAK